MEENIENIRCGYCGKFADAAPDHIFARTFFKSPSSNPNKINHIKIPSCKKCQNKSATEEEAAVLFNLSSDRELGSKHIKGIERSINELHSDKYDLLLNGIIEDKYLVKIHSRLDLKSLIKHMAMELVYEYITKSPVNKRYPWRIASFMPAFTESETFQIIENFNAHHPNNIFSDNGRYNDEIKYWILFDDKRKNVLVYFKIFNSLLLNSKSNSVSRYFAAAFSVHKFSCARYMLAKEARKKKIK